ncbi:MAG: hypothetical protein WBJ10_14320, partial [Daejeonella sp.]|uniref:hypothetical protein n=1 Tax=Daejeonella sp. TaxID=2805397 RepID=UPI003C72FA31
MMKTEELENTLYEIIANEVPSIILPNDQHVLKFSLSPALNFTGQEKKQVYYRFCYMVYDKYPELVTIRVLGRDRPVSFKYNREYFESLTRALEEESESSRAMLLETLKIKELVFINETIESLNSKFKNDSIFHNTYNSTEDNSKDPW